MRQREPYTHCWESEIVGTVESVANGHRGIREAYKHIDCAPHSGRHEIGLRVNHTPSNTKHPKILYNAEASLAYPLIISHYGPLEAQAGYRRKRKETKEKEKRKKDYKKKGKKKKKLVQSFGLNTSPFSFVNVASLLLLLSPPCRTWEGAPKTSGADPGRLSCTST